MAGPMPAIRHPGRLPDGDAAPHPRRTDAVSWQGWRFEVLDVDSHRVDQVLITRLVG